MLKDFAVQVDRPFGELERRRLQSLGKSYGITCRISEAFSFDSPPTAYSYSDQEEDDGWSGGDYSDPESPFDKWDRYQSDSEDDEGRMEEAYMNS